MNFIFLLGGCCIIVSIWSKKEFAVLFIIHAFQPVTRTMILTHALRSFGTIL